ncbi:winged helix-turn-helix transcriptional regulator, partial [Candidatus Nomurabacteria bacterium]|nr:winged helix-turn-helix transcriptional regulator [Candidatus Nomurabacteria bacterium]
DVVEKAGTGIIRIKEAMKNEGLRPPVFEDKGRFFKIILFRPKGVKEVIRTEAQKNVLENVLEKLGAKLNKSQADVLKILIENPKATNTELAKKMGITDRTIRRCLDHLKKNNVVKRIGPDKGGHWEIITPN